MHPNQVFDCVGFDPNWDGGYRTHALCSTKAGVKDFVRASISFLIESISLLLEIILSAVEIFSSDFKYRQEHEVLLLSSLKTVQHSWAYRVGAQMLVTFPKSIPLIP